jgi:type II secretory pathway pseudopilin PulG
MTCPNRHAALIAPHDAADQRGFSLMEAVVATAIAVIAIVGLAHSFGLGRALVNRYEVGRAALGLAQQRMEDYASHRWTIVPAPPDSLPFVYGGNAVGVERWSIEWVDDPFDGTGAGDTNGPNDMKRVTVKVYWGGGIEANEVVLTRLFPPS